MNHQTRNDIFFEDMLSVEDKTIIKEQLVSCLNQNDEIQRIVIFGSFLNSDDPEDLDVAVFQNSSASYVTLALEYCRLARSVSEQIPLDIIPVHANATNDPFLMEIERGETIYER